VTVTMTMGWNLTAGLSSTQPEMSMGPLQAEVVLEPAATQCWAVVSHLSLRLDSGETTPGSRVD
jgi:hypothetical protein